MEEREVVIIGGGPAGMAAAIAAHKAGARDVLIIEREERLGGILQQCVHNGFGLHVFKEELTGPEYALRYADEVAALPIEVRLNTFVVDLSPTRVLTCISAQDGLTQIHAEACVLAMGCRERPRGALPIAGSRPAGVYSAGTAQRLINLEGLMPGHKVVILGSGDIGLIMARRMVLQGAEVLAVAELLPYSSGLKRNIQQCLVDFGIPLLLSTTAVAIHGKERVESVTLAQVDEARRPIPGTEFDLACDTVLLSCGLIPEGELARAAGVELSGATQGALVDDALETSVPGVFAAGNVLHVHDLADHVSQEAAVAGASAARYAQGLLDAAASFEVIPGAGVRYTVPHTIALGRTTPALIRFRVTEPTGAAYLVATLDGHEVLRKRKVALTPGEMQELTLAPAKLEGAHAGSTLTISVEKA